MRRRRLLAALGTLAAAGALAGCAQTVQGHPSAPSLDFGSRLERAMATVTSAHVQLHLQAPGIEATSSGDEQLAGGKATAFDFTEQISGVGALRVREVKGVLYVQLPADLNPTDKPWIQVDPSTTDPTLAQLAQALSTLQQSASVDQYTLLAQAAGGLTDLGTDTVSGVATEHYSYDVLVDRLPPGMPGASVLRAQGVHRIPVQMWLDGKNRLVRTLESMDFGGLQSFTNVTLSAFDEPVTIIAPPPDQVATH